MTPAWRPSRQLLIARTEGNPFFLEESVRTLVETRVLVGERGAYRLAQALPSIQVPATVQAVLAARIDRLPPEEKNLLQAAAVIGKDVPAALLQATAEVPWAAVQRSLAHLQAAEFLYETTLFPELAYTFKHALTQEVAYNAVLLERRRGLHERAAQAIEGLFAERLPEHYNALAHHYSRSGNTPKAVDYLHRAGQQAVERSAYAEAISPLTTALDLLTTLPESRERSQQELAVQMTLGTALRATKGGGAPEVERLYTRARELCEQVGEPPQLFRVLWGLWGVYYHARRISDDAGVGGAAPQPGPAPARPGPPARGPPRPVGHLVLWRRARRRPAPPGTGACGSMSRNGTAPMPRSTAGTTPGCVAACSRRSPSGSSGTPTRRWPASRRRWPWPSSSPTP